MRSVYLAERWGVRRVLRERLSRGSRAGLGLGADEETS